ncbi:Transcriptional regulator, LuxR family protein [Myxococcus hansupus]|uniref:Transcriptional regulator, LuxR family protein n=1 Tax=Pseudomyxococcus hansupus TaxID=1297742 RepID=A0A0H4XBY9_9BACT|nr:helix-turn-helix transcriptional regulator [Myxococcus hansupus]AKQ65472.1 Transcriptional regulator, LuxR family protein [Myxococcus hansupus]
MLREGRQPLARLIASDYMAMCIVTAGPPVRYQWLEEAGAPNKLLAQYASLQPNDFVLQSVVRRRGTVLRDSEMISRRELVRSPLYLQSRDMGMNLEQVMAVLLEIQPGVFCGITLYRDRRRAFSRREQAAMQFLTRDFTVAIRNSRLIATPSRGDRLLEALSQRQQFETILMVPPSTEIHRSDRASALLKKWFPLGESARRGPPACLLERLNALTRMDIHERARHDTMDFRQDNQLLLVNFVEMPAHDGPRQWALFLHEFPKSISLPSQLAKQLTPRQIEVAEAMLNNKSDEEIAEALGIKKNTAKVHVRDIYESLKCSTRGDFMYQALQLMKPI